MRRLLAILALLSILAILACLPGFVQPARAQSEVALKDVGVTYIFGDRVNFAAKIQAASPPKSAFLLFQVEGDPNTRTIPLTRAADGTANYQYSIKDGILRPFSKIFFWYHLAFANGQTFDSPRYFFQYDDNRYPWQTVESQGLRLHWVAGDVSFGQAALNAAIAGYQAIQTLLPGNNSSQIDIYIYATAADVQDALNLGGLTWVGGHASPDLGVVLVSIAPGETQSIEMERQIPHELAHVLLYRQTGPAYANLPTWLSEGLASQVEQYPSSDYAQVLAITIKNKALIPLADLCGVFPADASGAILAYAESDSFTRYLHQTYGTSSLQTLIQAYSDGLSCDQGARRALGLSLSQLDARWQQAALGQAEGGLAFQNLLPYLALLAFMLIIPVWVLLRKKPKMKKEEILDRRRPR